MSLGVCLDGELCGANSFQRECRSIGMYSYVLTIISFDPTRGQFVSRVGTPPYQLATGLASPPRVGGEQLVALAIVTELIKPNNGPRLGLFAMQPGNCS